MELIEKQIVFSQLLAKFIIELTAKGYGVTGGEWYRSEETCELYAKMGKGIKNSLHTLRIAVDLNLFRNGRFLRLSEEYKQAGEIWEHYSTQDFNCAWGGRFLKPDGNHFSIVHAGIR